MTTIEEINAARADNVSKGLPAYTGAGATATNPAPIPANAPITSSDLKQTTSLSIPSPYVSTTADSISGTAGAMVDQNKALQAKLDAEASAAKENKDQSKDALTGLMNEIVGIQGGRAQAESDAGLPQKRQKLTDVTNQIEADQRAQQNETKAIQANGGISQEAQNGMIRNVNMSHATYQADLAIIQSAANRDYATAQSIIDRKIELQLEPLKTKLDFQKMFYEDNKDSFNKAEQKQYQNLVTNSQREYDEAKVAKKTLEDTRLETLKAVNENPDTPQSVKDAVMKAATPEEVLSAAGTFGRDQLKQLQIEKAKVDLANANDKSTYTSPFTTDYSSFLQSRSPQQIIAFNGLPSNDKSIVAQLVNGDALISDIVKSRGAQGTKDIQKYINEAQAVDPTFSVNNNKVRYTFMQGWNNPNGKSSTTRNALNTALGHLADFKVNADALDSGAIKKLNSVKNILTTETGDPKVLRLRTDINALATEIATAYKGGQPTETEIKNWEETIAADFSKSQFAGVTEELTKLLSSKITASRYQFKSTMGYEYGQQIIDPDKKKALIDVGVSPDVFPNEVTGNPKDNEFGKSLYGGSSDVYSTSTGMFNIPTNNSKN